MKKIKILHVFQQFSNDSYGGIEEVIRQLCIRTQKFNIENKVFTLQKKKNVPFKNNFNNIMVVSCPTTFRIASTSFSMNCFKAFKRETNWADIIHYHFPWPFADLLHLLIVRKKKPAIVTYHSDIVRQKILKIIYTPLMYYFLNSMKLTITDSPQYKKTSKILSKLKSEVTAIQIDLDRKLMPDPDKERIAFWKSKLSNKFFLFIGRLTYYKGVHFLVDALKGTGYPCVIAGDGQEMHKIKKKIKDLKINNIHLTGSIAHRDKIALLHLCYALVLPSIYRSEAFGIVLLEGAMFGKPLISTELGTATSKINIHNETGIVVPPHNTEMLRNALTDLWENPQKVRKFGKNAKKHFERNFASKDMSFNYAQVYQRIYNNHIDPNFGKKQK